MTLTNRKAIRLVARQAVRLPDADLRRRIALLVLAALTAPTDPERDRALADARRLLRETLPRDDDHRAGADRHARPQDRAVADPDVVADPAPGEEAAVGRGPLAVRAEREPLLRSFVSAFVRAARPGR